MSDATHWLRKLKADPSWEGIAAGSPCGVCGVKTKEINEYYMLRDEVWAKANSNRLLGYLCLGCVELRLGRELTGSDFSSAPINSIRWERSPRLVDRLTRKI